MIDSPFSGDRFEHDRQHLYFLPGRIVTVLQDVKPAYLIGGRGTGKTTLLQALNWRERLTNRQLSDQFPDGPFEGLFIGVYLKLPEIQLKELHAWLEGDEFYPRVFAIYLDLLWTQLVVDAIGELIASSGMVSVPTGAEHGCVEQIVEQHRSCLGPFLPQHSPRTLRDLHRCLAQLQEQIDSARDHREDTLAVIDRLHLPREQVGSFGQKIATHLAGLCSDADSGRTWRFKICMDEAEELRPIQFKIVNTMVRMSKGPVSFVLALGVEPPEISTTLLDHLPLGLADRRIVFLDRELEDDFFQFAEGVASVRVEAFLRDPTARVDLKRMFGVLDLNGVLDRAARTATNRDLRELRTRAVNLAEHPFFSEVSQPADSPPPIYQTYLIEKLGLALPTPGEPKWVRRQQDSRELRKRNVAAYLSICHEFGLDVRYFSAEMIIQMSDQCIRDFLNQMHALFIESERPVEQFISSRMPDARQGAALETASKKKGDDLQVSGVRTPIEVNRIIHGLARMTSIIQASGSQYSHLRTSERGKFVLDSSSAVDDPEKESLEMLLDAAQAGYFKLLSERDAVLLRFRVHTSLAAAYRFSYRGAYYESRITFQDLWRLRKTTAPDELEKVIAAIAARIGGPEDESQLYLPGMEP